MRSAWPSSDCASRLPAIWRRGASTGNLAALLSSVGFAGYAVCLRTDPHRDWSPVMPGYAVMMIVICGVVTADQR